MANKYRKKIIAGNWKMNKSVGEATELANAIKMDLANFGDADVVLCPPFTSIPAVCDAVQDSQIKVGAQNMHWEASGAFTGEISAAMLRDLYCRYVILGHSERRSYCGETDAIVNKKVKAALAAHLNPIVCIGETLEERDSGRAQEVVRSQVMGSMADLGADLGKLVLAYEPVWAIGTGRTATPEQAQEMHALIRNTLETMSDSAMASGIRIQYGGSMKPENAGELLGQPDIDGGLIGGAALDALSFVKIVKATAE